MFGGKKGEAGGDVEGQSFESRGEVKCLCRNLKNFF